MDIDQINRRRIKQACAAMIDSINVADVCALASEYNNGRACRVFAESRAGNYNVCFFVEFVCDADADADADPESSPTRWVVRFPLPSVYDARKKLASEVATMRYILAKTSIPIPRVHGYALGEEEQNDGISNPTRRPFLLLDFIQGVPWHGRDLPNLPDDKSKRFYGQLGQIYAQLRAQEFSQIGSLFQADDDKEEVRWRIKAPLSMDQNDQAMEGLDPSAIVNKTYVSAVDYCFALYQLLYNMFKKQRNSVYDEDDAKSKIYAREQFRGMLFGWLEIEYNDGPFVLMHGDLRPNNIIIDEDYNIISIVDWEWSRIVPLQLFVLPTWLTGYDAGTVAGPGLDAGLVIEQYKLLRAMTDMQTDARVNALQTYWSASDYVNRFLPSALLRFWYFDEIYRDSLHRGYHKSLVNETIKDFFTRRATKGLLELVRQKMTDLECYRAELKTLGIVPDEPIDNAALLKGEDEKGRLEEAGRIRASDSVEEAPVDNSLKSRVKQLSGRIIQALRC